MNLSASLPKRAENFAHPVCGSSEISTTTVSPIASRLPVGRLSLSRPMSTSRLSPASGQRSGSAISPSSRVDAIVSWLSRCTRPSASTIWLPPVTDEALLDRELGRVGRLALALARADDDQLQRPVLGAERSKLGKPLVEALAGRVEIRAHGPRCYRPPQRPDRTSKSALSFAASSGSSRGDDLPLVSAALLTTRACTPRSSRVSAANAPSGHGASKSWRGVTTRPSSPRTRYVSSSRTPSRSYPVPPFSSGSGACRQPSCFEKRSDPRQRVEPDRDVDVAVRSRDRAGVEVDRPAAEQPVLDPGPLEEGVDAGERGELGRREAAVRDERERRAVGRDVLARVRPPRTQPRSQSGKNVSPSTSASISVSTSSSASGSAAAKSSPPPMTETRSSPESELERLVERAGALGALRVPVGFRVTTTFRRPGSGRKRSGSDSQVRRPITTG